MKKVTMMKMMNLQLAQKQQRLLLLQNLQQLNHQLQNHQLKIQAQLKSQSQKNLLMTRLILLQFLIEVYKYYFFFGGGNQQLHTILFILRERECM